MSTKNNDQDNPALQKEIAEYNAAGMIAYQQAIQSGIPEQQAQELANRAVQQMALQKIKSILTKK